MIFSRAACISFFAAIVFSLMPAKASFTCNASLDISQWPSVPGETPILAQVEVGVCLKGTKCELGSGSGRVEWSETSSLLYSDELGGLMFGSFQFADSARKSTAYNFASKAVIFSSSTAAPFVNSYSFSSKGNVGLTITNATSRLDVAGSGDAQQIYFRTILLCKDECSAACKKEYDDPGPVCYSQERIRRGETAKECYAKRYACFVACR